MIKLYDNVYKLNMSSFSPAFELNYVLINMVLIIYLYGFTKIKQQA